MAHQHIMIDLVTGKACRIEIHTRALQSIVEVAESSIDENVLKLAREEAAKNGFAIDHTH